MKENREKHDFFFMLFDILVYIILMVVYKNKNWDVKWVIKWNYKINKVSFEDLK